MGRLHSAHKYSYAEAANMHWRKMQARNPWQGNEIHCYNKKPVEARG